MVKDIFDTILEKDYHQLTPNELSELGEFCQNEKEFLAFKEVIAKTKVVSAGPKLTSREVSKEKLDHLFETTYGNSKKGFLFYRNPLFQVAASLLFVIVTWAFYNYTSSLPGKQQLAENTTPTKEITPKENKNELVKLEDKKEVVNDVIQESKNNSEKEVETIVQTQPINVNKDQRSSPVKTRQAEDNTLTGKADASGMVSTFEWNDEKLAEKETDKKDKVDQQEKTYRSYSAPASSVKDIQVDASKRSQQNVALTSMSCSSQNNVLKFLVVKY